MPKLIKWILLVMCLCTIGNLTVAILVPNQFTWALFGFTLGNTWTTIANSWALRSYEPS